ncbi:MAG TPA: DnaD domain protein [Ktedonobacterales bacterium]
MPAFVGFPAGKTPYVPLPQTFFTSILPGVEDIGELKLTLYLFQLLYRKRGAPRCVSDRELLSDRVLRQALRRKGDPRAPEERLRAALELSVARGTLLRVRVRVDGEIVSWYFFNTDRSRRAVARLLRGELAPEALLDLEGDEGGKDAQDSRDLSGRMQIEVERPTIFLLYEQNVGLLTPLVAEELREAEERYPAEWIEEAFRLAIQQNKRKWSYIRAILKRWETEGKAG